MMIEVRDYYSNDKWEPIDFYTSALADVPLSIKSSNSTYTVRKRFSSLFNFNSTLIVQSKVNLFVPIFRTYPTYLSFLTLLLPIGKNSVRKER